ncbi:hypothetical protein [Micromonospora arborensis]|uniref:hypothetical protein n=1 Tax=Micromonospora arborensis TaxID=2116518 RepID=UPI003712F952
MTPADPDPGRDDVAGFMLRSYAETGHLSFTAPSATVLVRRARRRTTTKVVLSFATVVAVAGGIAAIVGLGPDPDRDPPIIGPTPAPSVSVSPTPAPAPPPTPATTSPSTPPDPPAPSRSASPNGTPSAPASSSGEDASPSGDGVFSGTRKVAISMESGPPAYLVVGADGKVVGNVRLTERSVFVPVPAGGRQQIRTAFADNSCVGVRRNADGPPTLVVAVCAPEAEGQLFRFVPTDERDSEGRRTYRIESTSGPVTFNSLNGLHVQDPDNNARVTGFAAIDQGPA